MQSEGIKQYSKLVLLAGFASVSTAVLFIVIKFAVWLFSSSSVIFASLTDSVFDCLASLINLLALRFSLTPPDSDHRFGHYKSQSLASLAQAAFIGGSAVLLIIHGIEHSIKPQPIGNIDMAIIVSMVTIVLTILLVLFQTYVYRLTRSESIAADRLHYLSDVTLNIGVIVALVLSRMGYDWADGLFSAMIGVFILKGAYDIARSSVQTLLDRSADGKTMNRIVEDIIKIPEVRSIHDIKTRIAGPIIFVQGHIVLDPKMPLSEAHAVVCAVELSIRADFPDAEITLHMEPDESFIHDEVVFDEYSREKNNQAEAKNKDKIVTTQANVT